MSDLISRSELLKEIEKYKFGAISNDAEREYIKKTILDFIICQPTAYSVDKVVEEVKTDSSVKLYGSQNSDNYMIPVNKAIEIVKQAAAEYNNGWIPCSVRLPEDAFGCLVTIIDCEPSTQTDFENILPYVVGYDGDSWNDSDGNVIPFEVIAWQPLPELYKERD